MTADFRGSIYALYWSLYSDWRKVIQGHQDYCRTCPLPLHSVSLTYKELILHVIVAQNNIVYIIIIQDEPKTGLSLKVRNSRVW